jgi:hypothetical protein
MRGAIPPLPRYAFMSWYSVKKDTGTTLNGVTTQKNATWFSCRVHTTSFKIIFLFKHETLCKWWSIINYETDNRKQYCLCEQVCKLTSSNLWPDSAQGLLYYRRFAYPSSSSSSALLLGFCQGLLLYKVSKSYPDSRYDPFVGFEIGRRKASVNTGQHKESRTCSQLFTEWSSNKQPHCLTIPTQWSLRLLGCWSRFCKSLSHADILHQRIYWSVSRRVLIKF